MYVLVTYDVAVTSEGGKRRLRTMAKTCLDYGQRVQNSVFELLVDPAQWTQCKSQLCEIADPQLDSLRFYYLGANWKNRVEHYGVDSSTDMEGPLIV